MPGVTTGQVFTQEELEALMAWYTFLPRTLDEDVELWDKLERYRAELAACKVPSI